ncbi:hypothetical protein SAMN05720764_1083 [Fibrobacter sp. UWH5]|uniref:hypothetical protein n=1 Tax=Fibrobacter sp. UWH5 TaxID=1896211 RepID=UPI0009147D2E|nr:hypothetical protein [Fibrobacter sp. UWH5]SHL11631.1 hypothetical protein SAMN05720764_1083 [Fibrobacter sp. UWH5]
MLKYFKTVPVYFLLFYAMMCYGFYGVHVLYRMFWFTTERMAGHGIATSLVFGFSAAFLVAAFRVYLRRGQNLLGVSLVYAGTFVCCWLYRFGEPFLGRYPRHFSIYSDYSILFITAVSLLALHFAVKLIRR